MTFEMIVRISNVINVANISTVKKLSSGMLMATMIVVEIVKNRNSFPVIYVEVPTHGCIN